MTEASDDLKTLMKDQEQLRTTKQCWKNILILSNGLNILDIDKYNILALKVRFDKHAALMQEFENIQ